MGKESFLIYNSFYKPISKLSDKQLGRLFRAIFKYHLGEIVTVEEDIEIAFEFFKNQFEIDESKYKGIVERNRNNGSKGGAPKRAKNDDSNGYITQITQTNPNNPMGFHEPKKPDNDNDNDNEEKEISLSRDKEKVPPPDIFDEELSVCYDELANDRSWVEVVTMNTRSSGHKDFTIGAFMEYLRLFFQKLQNEGETRKSPKDAKSHFANWLRIELDKKKRNEKSAKDKRVYATTDTQTGEGIGIEPPESFEF